MHEEVFRAIESGATAITASRRLARVLTAEFHSQQRAQGRSVWNTPDILPLDAFLGRVWRDAVLRGRAGAESILLDSIQEQMIWEQVIRESPAGDSLLQIPETARGAMEAWQLVHAYRLPVDGRFEGSEDWSAYAGWSRAFRKRCQSNKWIEGARLSDVVVELFESGEAERPSQLYVAGFDDFTPQQTALFKALGKWRNLEQPAYQPAPHCWKLRDSSEEIHASARWARQILEQNPEAQIGVIVPNLDKLRPKVERIFREVLDPGGEFDDRERSFHLSLGPALHQYPAAHAALLLLEFGLGKLTLPRAGMLLRSPFIQGAETEWTQRALLDAKLRRNGVWELTPIELRDAAAHCPLLQRVLTRFAKELAKLPGEQRASEWSRDFSKLLEVFGWPGERTMSSREYQVVEAWNGLLSNLATLDIAAPTMTFEHALERLRHIAKESPFQVENQGAPVQIMGLFEASGLRFDHLWVMGLHDEALPAPANPNPFLPILLQREHKLPHSSAEREAEFANMLMERLLASARNLALSYPETEGDRALSPSPLLDRVPEFGVPPALQYESWMDRLRAEATFEEMTDDRAPAAAVDSKHHGGASLFKDMAACPFRAFAKHRLGARKLEDADFGLSYGDRGNSVHKALQFIWAELGSQARLLELAPDQLQELVVRNVRDALAQMGLTLGRDLEQRRLEKLLAEWLEIERSREPFIVHTPEEEREVTIGGVQVSIRADRVDELANGRDIILDYKTGQLNLGGWDGERPDEPQLPLYCATSDRPIAGASLVAIRVGELAFRGVTESGVSLPGLKKMTFAENVPFGELMAQWRRVLERLAIDYRSGHAEVDPKHDACDHCGLRALCRIREYENDRG
ncbi:MAG TPA: PD-(D/E)XK nuclease family protein [Bryobacteraceae bacterium]|nr:PD-(D/E)XK nuclease family protein [Bryobacteraceae bacterium]